MLSHQSLGVCEVSDPYPLHCLRYLEKTHSLITAGVCCCLQTYNSNVNLEGMGVLFTHKLHCLQTFEHMSALLAIKA